MQHLADEGFVPLFETVRRDNCPAWKAYFDFNVSYARYVEYLIARYGVFNLIFSGIHLDWIPKNYSLTGDEFNAALTYHWKTYGPLPFGQPYTTLIDSSTFKVFGHGDHCPWLTMHTVGNKPRNHAIYASLEEIFRLSPPCPAANLEPYYTGWNHEINRPGGETPAVNSDRDNYFARAMMYGSVLSGGLAGHVHGTAAYDVTSTGEPAGWRPHIWDAREDGLDGWAFMMRTPERDFALLYFENKAVRPQLNGFSPGARYRWMWFDPRTGGWRDNVSVAADVKGALAAPAFPRGGAIRDWAAKVTRIP
jgi:hypothetical protein